MGQIMMKVWTKISVAGVHCWPEAPRSYLASPHRHLFVINVACKVPRTFANVDGRSVEFFDLQDAVRGVLRRLYSLDGNRYFETYDFETRSCERIALEIATVLSSFPPMVPPGATEVEVDVSEDGESGGTVSTVQRNVGLVVFVCGKAYSGKSTISDRIAKALFDCDVVEVSDIVREYAMVSKDDLLGPLPLTRSVLQASTEMAVAQGKGADWLVSPVLREVHNGFERVGAVVISGVREPLLERGVRSGAMSFGVVHGQRTPVVPVYLKVEAPDDVRQYRLQQELLIQVSPGSSLGDLGQLAADELPKIDEGDRKLGMDDVLAKCPMAIQTTGKPADVARLAVRYVFQQYVNQCVAGRSD